MNCETPDTSTKSDDAADREFGHPLRAIPWFRRLPTTTTVSTLLTALLALVCSFAFVFLARTPESLSDFWVIWRTSLIYSLFVGYSIQLLSQVFVPTIRLRLRDRPFIARLIADIAVWTGGALLGYAIAATVLGHGVLRPDSTVLSVILAALFMAIITGVAMRQHAVSEIKAEREKAERSETQRTLAVSRLRLLQAQIEPHFLFNTLANVSSLIESDPQQARRMLDQFTLLLRASLDQTRKETTTLNAELQVIEAYLSVLKVRMGDRLVYDIDAPTELHTVPVPAMLLQPIVENAVKHGIEPRVKGGRVTVQVRRESDYLCFVVSDDGVGFVPNSRENIGLGAVRERLAVQYGSAAVLQVERRSDEKTYVTIRIPFPQ